MERRIFGLENEYGVTCTLRGQRRLSPDEVARYLFRRVVSWGRSSNVFLENGARLYLDVGRHPEYATPECDSIDDLVAHAEAERLRRQDVIGTDSAMRESDTRLKGGANSDLRRLHEDPSGVLRDMSLENPIPAIRAISHDITCRLRLRLANGREASAIDT